MEVEGDSKVSEKKYFIDTINLKVPRKGMEMTSFLNDGMGKAPGPHFFSLFPFFQYTHCCLASLINSCSLTL